MSEPSPRHPLEGYRPPHTPAERLLDEIHYGGQGYQLRHTSVTELETIHGKSEFARAFARMSFLAVKTEALVSSVDAESSMDIRQISSLIQSRRIGGLMALHTLVPSIPNRADRDTVRKFDILGKGYMGLSEAEISAQLLDEYDRRHEMIELQNDDLKDALSHAASALYSDYPDNLSPIYQDNFKFGYLSAGTRITYITEAIARRRQAG